jgi:hypothetical protein
MFFFWEMMDVLHVVSEIGEANFGACCFDHQFVLKIVGFKYQCILWSFTCYNFFSKNLVRNIEVLLRTKIK